MSGSGAGRAGELVLGIDFGTDSVRCVAVDPSDGSVAGQAVRGFPRWAQGAWCDARASRFRQHPLDHIESMTECVRAALAEAGPGSGERVRGIGIDGTASTPCFADASGSPLALDPRFADDPDAMFIMWKDHMAIPEAQEVNRRAATWGGTDFTAFEGGIYSAEWLWAKALRVVRTNPRVAAAASTIVEHCDWVPAMLAGKDDATDIPRSRCAAGFKGMWHASWGGYPDAAFLAGLHPRLAELAATLPSDTLASDRSIGTISPQWAERLGVSPRAVVASGSIDAHLGAVGGGIGTGTMLKIMGTSTCDIIIGDEPAPGAEVPVPGICGQTSGSVIPGYMGYEAGQSAFGDIFAWFRNLLMWPVRQVDPAMAAGMEEKVLGLLGEAGRALPPLGNGLVALDWLNGRRTPDADQRLKGAIAGLDLGTDAPAVFRALVEAAAFGSRAILERFESRGVPVGRILAVGGVARKSPFVMQVTADVLGREIGVSAEDQASAKGSAMSAAVAAGIHRDLPAAQAAMGSGIEKVYAPDPGTAAVYAAAYRRYLELGAFMESQAG